MAVVQISRIQVRRGQATQSGLPQLASGEIGWAIDTQEMYIGNGSVAEGAPAVGNTRILTENDLFSSINLNTYYTFSATTAIVTGIDANHPTVRTLQEKLDDTVTTKDFGIMPGTTCTVSLQKAIDEVFLNSGKTNQPLRVPAGTYYVTSTIYIPKNTTLVGDGIDKTVIVSQGVGNNATVFRTHGGTQLNRTLGLQIQSTNQPEKISISGITFTYSTATNITNTAPLIIIDGCEDSEIVKNKFLGPYQTGKTASSGCVGIDLQGNLTLGISIKDNVFEQLVYPVYSDYDVNEIKIKENKFNFLYQGVTLARALTGAGVKQFGPKNVDIEGNIFKHIEREGLYVGPSTSTYVAIQSNKNTFIDVGNGSSLGNSSNDGNAITPVITFESQGGSSREDSFERFEYYQTAVGATKKPMPLVDGADRFELKYARTIEMLTTSPATTQTLFNIPYVDPGTSLTIDYVMSKPGRIRTGELTVLCKGSESAITDTFTYIGDTDGSVVFQSTMADPLNTGNYSAKITFVNPTLSNIGTLVATISAIW